MTPGRARHVPEGDELDLLMRCTGYRFNRNGVACGRAEPATAEDLAEAERLGWPVRRPERVSAVDIAARSSRAAGLLRRSDVARAFAAGVGGSAPRGRQVLISYAWAAHLPADAQDCGLAPVEEIDVTDQLVRLACGWAWNELPASNVVDLEAAVSQGLPEPTEADWAAFDRLVAVVAAQPAAQTPGGLERELARAKVLPRTDKYQRYGILIGLAEAGVLPNSLLPPSLDRFVPLSERHRADRAARGGPRSDVPVPLSGWRGALGVDRERLSDLFGR